MDWSEIAARCEARFADGLSRLPDEPDARQKQLVRVANAAGGVGLVRLMEGRSEEASLWLTRAAERYRESYAGAPPGSWGRLIGAVKARLLAGDASGADADARWALEQRPDAAESPIGRYAACLALLTLGEDEAAGPLAVSLLEEPEESFPRPVARALAALAERDAGAYELAVRDVLASFEAREAYLEDVPVADTVIVLERLATERGVAAAPVSELLPG